MSGPVSAAPVLPVSDVVRSVAWYERLGFQVRAVYEGYAILSFDSAELHLNEIPTLPPASESVSGAYLRVHDADSVHAHWSAMGAPTIAPPEDQPYGIREFATEDPDGNLWRVGAPIPDGPADGDVPDDPPHHEPAGEPTPDPSGEQSPGEHSSDDGSPASGERCPVCGLVEGELAARAIGAQVRDEVHPFGELLARADDELVRRHAPGGWSALEHGVHVRDALSRFAEHIIRVLAEHGPQLGTWDPEASVADGMANESDVGAVVDDLQRNAAKLSEALRLVSDDDWARPATQGDEPTTIELLARAALHEVVHRRTLAGAALAAAPDGAR